MTGIILAAGASLLGICLAAVPVAGASPALAGSSAPVSVPIAVLGGQGEPGGASPTVQITVGGWGPLRVVLDTGSSGLHVFAGAVNAGSGVTVTNQASDITYSGGYRFKGVVASAVMQVGAAKTTGQVSFALVQSAGCASRPNQIVRPPVEFRGSNWTEVSTASSASECKAARGASRAHSSACRGRWTEGGACTSTAVRDSSFWAPEWSAVGSKWRGSSFSPIERRTAIRSGRTARFRFASRPDRLIPACRHCSTRGPRGPDLGGPAQSGPDRARNERGGVWNVHCGGVRRPATLLVFHFGQREVRGPGASHR